MQHQEKQEDYHHRRSTFLLSHVCLQLHTNNRRRIKEDTLSFYLIEEEKTKSRTFDITNTLI